MFINETKKTMKSMAFAIIVFVVGYFISLCISKSHYDKKNVQYYKSYIDKLEGRLTPEKEEYIRKEYDKVIGLLDKYSQAIREGKFINVDMDELSYATDHKEAFNMIYDRYNYIVGLKDNIEQEIFYDLDLNDYIKKTNINYFEIFTILLVSLFSIIMEYQEDRIALIKTSCKGKKKFMIAKQNSVILSALLASALFYFADFVFFCSKAGFDVISKPARSINYFSELNTKMSIGQYLLFRGAYHLLWCVGVALIMVLFGLLFKKIQNGMFVGVVSIIIQLVLADVAKRSNLIWFYGVHMNKDFSVLTFGLNGALYGILWIVILYFVNIMAWRKSGNKNDSRE